MKMCVGCGCIKQKKGFLTVPEALTMAIREQRGVAQPIVECANQYCGIASAPKFIFPYCPVCTQQQGLYEEASNKMIIKAHQRDFKCTLCGWFGIAKDIIDKQTQPVASLKGLQK